jgi:hypothetical protein
MILGVIGERGLGRLAYPHYCGLTLQQGLVSLIAEMLIAAALALPELLRRERPAVASPGPP